MIWIITGKIGGGKTLYVVNEALKKFAAGGLVMGNVFFKHDQVAEIVERRYNRKYDAERQFQLLDYELEPMFQNKLQQGVRGSSVMVIIDEAHLYYPAHGHATQDKILSKLNSFMSQSRKVHIDLFFITQDISILYHRIKAQAEHRIHCLDARKKTLPFIGAVPGAGLKWVEKDVKSNMVLGGGSTPLDPKIFDCYDSFQMYDEQMRNLKLSMPIFEPLNNKLPPFTGLKSSFARTWKYLKTH